MDMPHDLQTGITREGARVSKDQLVAATAALSLRYRGRDAPQSGALIQSELDVAAYLTYRLPATFAAIHAVFVEIRARRPDWQPLSLLDVGAGPGTAAWAAVTVWPGLERVTLVERDRAMIAAGTRLMAASRTDALRNADWQTTDIHRPTDDTSYDLVVAAYVLGEIPPPHTELLDRLWQRSSGMLALIEPGTPRGFAHIRSARDHLLAEDARTIAPCPHDRPCPLVENDWCHFAQRINRTPLHREAKGATLSYEDEKYSYAVMARVGHEPIAGRVIRHPITRPGNITLQLSTPAGIERVTVTRKNAAAFRAARHLRWGSVAPPEVVSREAEESGSDLLSDSPTPRLPDPLP